MNITDIRMYCVLKLNNHDTFEFARFDCVLLIVHIFV